MQKLIQAVPPNTELHIHIEDLGHVDHACLDLLMNWEKQHEATGGSLVIDWDSLTAKFRQVRKKNRNNRRAAMQGVDEDGAEAAAPPCPSSAGTTEPGS